MEIQWPPLRDFLVWSGHPSQVFAEGCFILPFLGDFYLKSPLPQPLVLSSYFQSQAYGLLFSESLQVENTQDLRKGSNLIASLSSPLSWHPLQLEPSREDGLCLCYARKCCLFFLGLLTTAWYISFLGLAPSYFLIHLWDKVYK